MMTIFCASTSEFEFDDVALASSATRVAKVHNVHGVLHWRKLTKNWCAYCVELMHQRSGKDTYFVITRTNALSNPYRTRLSDNQTSNKKSDKGDVQGQ